MFTGRIVATMIHRWTFLDSSFISASFIATPIVAVAR
jgi:hypothetical protein